MCIRDSSYTVKGEPHQQLLTTFLGKMVDLYTVMTCYFADAMEEVDRVAEDKGLKESLGRYAIESGAIMEQVLSLIHIFSLIQFIHNNRKFTSPFLIFQVISNC